MACALHESATAAQDPTASGEGASSKLDVYLKWPPKQKLNSKQAREFVRVMRTNMDSEDMQEAGCLAIASRLCELPANRSVLVTEGVIKRVFSAMDAYPDSASVIAASCSAFAALSCDESVAATIFSSGGLERAFSVLAAFRHKPLVVSKACTFLEVFACAQERMFAFIGSKGFEHLLPVLIANVTSREACLAGLHFFQRIATIVSEELIHWQAEVITTQAFDNGLLDWICAVMEHYLLDKEIVFKACNVSHRITCKESSVPVVAAQIVFGRSERFVKCMFDVLRVSVEIADVMMEAISAIRQISLHMPGSIFLLKLGVLQQLLSVLRVCPHAEVIGLSASAAANLVAHGIVSNSESSTLEPELRSSWLAIVDRAVELMSAHPSVLPIQFGGVTVISNCLGLACQLLEGLVPGKSFPVDTGDKSPAFGSVVMLSTATATRLFVFSRTKLLQIQKLVKAAVSKFPFDAAIQARGGNSLRMLHTLFTSPGYVTLLP